MTIGIAQAAVNLGVALTLGAVIGFERQWRQRLAGLRSNTLVALGAASFVVFENLFSTEANPISYFMLINSGILRRTPVPFRHFQPRSGTLGSKVTCLW